MINSRMTTAFASEPIWFHIERGSKLTVVSWSNQSDQSCNCTIIVFSLSCELIFNCPNTDSGLFLTQRKVHVYFGFDADWFAIERRGLIDPLLDRLEGGRDQQRMAADHLQIFDGA